MEFTAQQIADFLKGNVVGDPTAKVNNFSKIEEGTPGTITFLANLKYEHFIYKTKASIVLVNEDFVPTAPIEPTLIKVPNAYTSLARLLDLVEQSKIKKSGIDSSAFISATASVGENCYIGSFAYIGENSEIGKECMIYPHVYIGDNVKIGDKTILYPHSVIYNDCSIGKNCIIHAGAVIGSDGFGFASEENGEYKKIAQLGNVNIEDDVEIGANTTIDRAVMGSTTIHKGVKLDNLIQVAHNVEIGKNTAMAAQVGIAGSTKIGTNCVIAGQVGFGGHINIGDNTQIGAQSGIISNVKEGSRLMGTPAMPIKRHLRSSILLEKLPDIYKTLNKLEKEIEELKKNKQ
ncbi:MAG: UDP-3-O-(3-hydroxymyristoyl)glucosamine N-acyltransferase [Tannerella sp.]|jgi:UDP-3-O-[3-hydroxymyristoyl] glucosamine N-acyltransferase|nr:UDP-3-O-(3-hydroxymyristoyl)glucosamine N-acyltransferase [Tannerella sp.]